MRIYRMKTKRRLEPEAPMPHPTPDEVVKKVEQVLSKERKNKKRSHSTRDEAPSKEMQEAIEKLHQQNIKYFDDVEFGRIYLPQPGMSKREIEKLQDSVRRRIAYVEGTLQEPKRSSTKRRGKGNNENEDGN